MSHTIRKLKKKLTHRVARIRGQVEALARALDGEAERRSWDLSVCARRDGQPMAEVIEGHIRDHVFLRGAREVGRASRRGRPGEGRMSHLK
jgi:hypothetical protein